MHTNAGFSDKEQSGKAGVMNSCFITRDVNAQIYVQNELKGGCISYC